MVGESNGPSSPIDRRSYLGLVGASMLPVSTVTASGAEPTRERNDSSPGVRNRRVENRHTEYRQSESGRADDQSIGIGGQDLVIGYYPFWAESDPESLPYDSLTHLLFAFVYVDEEGTVSVQYGEDKLDAFREIREQFPDTEFMLSVGPPAEPEVFAQAASTQEGRERFAQTSADLLETYGFDGIDVDWEHPGDGGPHEYHDFTLLMETARAHLDQRGERLNREYSLSFATTPRISQGENLELDRVVPTVDFINLMAYGFAGPWSDTTGFNAPLYGPDRLSIDEMVLWWRNQPFRANKLALGLPFYGRYFTDVSGSNDGLDQPYDDVGVYTYEEVRQLDGEYSYTWHGRNAVPSLYSSQRREFVTFDDVRSIREKTEWAFDNFLGGVMIWNIDQDYQDELIGAIADSLPEGPRPMVGINSQQSRIRHR